MPLSPRIAAAISRRHLSEEDQKVLQELDLPDAGHGFDRFGLNREYVGLGLLVTGPFLYDRYFRVMSFGSEHVPRTGAVILAGNHSGTVPVDGMMLWVDVVRRVGRVPRAVADHFVPALPFVGTFFSRSGVVGGSRGNVRALLEDQQLLMVFPEGVPGVGKLYKDRYTLQDWRVGHAELAIRHGAPVVPVAFIGPEEQMPQIGKLSRVGKALGLPYLPIPATPLPMPVRYRIHYGEPLPLHEQYRPEQADDPQVVKQASMQVRDAVAELIRVGLKQRKGRLFT